MLVPVPRQGQALEGQVLVVAVAMVSVEEGLVGDWEAVPLVGTYWQRERLRVAVVEGGRGQSVQGALVVDVPW